MDVRVTAAPAGLIRLQIDDQVRYLNPNRNMPRAGTSPTVIDKNLLIPLVQPDLPVLWTDDCKIFVLQSPAQVDVVIVRTLPYSALAVAA